MRRSNAKIHGFKYTREGTPVSMTKAQWRELNHTHDRSIGTKGETWFTNRETKRLEFEAYGNIPDINRTGRKARSSLGAQHESRPS